MKIVVRKKHFDAAMAAYTKSWSKAPFRPLVWEEVCLIAQAIKGVFPGKKVSVSYSGVQIGRNNARMQFSLPEAVTNLMMRFDGGAYFGSGEGHTDLTKKQKTSLAKVRESLPIAFTLTEE